MTPLRTWRRVAMPLVRPVTAAVGALAFITSVVPFLDPLVYLYRRELFTVPLALRSLASLDPTNYPLLLAGAVLATLPVVAVFPRRAALVPQPDQGGLVARFLTAVVLAVALVAGAAACSDEEDNGSISFLVAGDPEELAAYRAR